MTKQQQHVSQQWLYRLSHTIFPTTQHLFTHHQQQRKTFLTTTFHNHLLQQLTHPIHHTNPSLEDYQQIRALLALKNPKKYTPYLYEWAKHHWADHPIKQKAMQNYLHIAQPITPPLHGFKSLIRRMILAPASQQTRWLIQSPPYGTTQKKAFSDKVIKKACLQRNQTDGFLPGYTLTTLPIHQCQQMTQASWQQYKHRQAQSIWLQQTFETLHVIVWHTYFMSLPTPLPKHLKP